jgi:Holliday junction DNA helicase RuvA
MITSIQGLLAAAAPLKAVIEINGFGYEVNIPLTTAEKLPPTGAVVKLHTLAIYREDSQALYGFATVPERDFFRLLIEHVTGVGPKVALSIMSRFSLPLLEGAIRAGDVATLAKCQGIGRKTAERLVVELRSKVGLTVVPDSPALGGASEEGSPHRDAVAALMALGYKAADADLAIRKAQEALGGQGTTEALIKKALNSA